MPKFVKEREHAPDDFTLIDRLERKKAYDKQRVDLSLSEEACDYFGFDGVYGHQIRWSKFIQPVENYKDDRPPEIKLLHRMFEPRFELRYRKTTMVLSPLRLAYLDDLVRELDIFNEPNLIRRNKIAFGHVASIVLEAIAAGYLVLKGNSNEN